MCERDSFTLLGCSWYSSYNRKSLYDSEEGLTGSQIQRGAFMNSGSKDVGRDHDWDKETRQWKGRYNKP